ncbi:hypothetical protein HK104_006109, partial [Borealophlyctis nickersoniae]
MAEPQPSTATTATIPFDADTATAVFSSCVQVVVELRAKFETWIRDGDGGGGGGGEKGGGEGKESFDAWAKGFLSGVWVHVVGKDEK